MAKMGGAARPRPGRATHFRQHISLLLGDPVEYCGFLNFWFLDRPIVERVAPIAALGLRRVDIWGWRPEPMAELAAECRRLGVIFNAAFDDQMGSLADPGDNERTLRSWAESLEMAARLGLEHLYLFSNQVDVSGEAAWARRLSANYTQAGQSANPRRQTEPNLNPTDKDRA